MVSSGRGPIKNTTFTDNGSKTRGAESLGRRDTVLWSLRGDTGDSGTCNPRDSSHCSAIGREHFEDSKLTDRT